MKIYCADVGSELRQNFAWANSNEQNGTSLESLLNNLVEDIKFKETIFIGFECPLYFEIKSNSIDVTKKREADNPKRSWSAAAGANSAITGLAQTTWLFTKLKEKFANELPECLILDSWDLLNDTRNCIIIWEAFISHSSKPKTIDTDVNKHIQDCKHAIKLFKEKAQKREINLVKSNECYSLIGATLLRTKCTNDITLLNKACYII